LPRKGLKRKARSPPDGGDAPKFQSKTYIFSCAEILTEQLDFSLVESSEIRYNGFVESLKIMKQPVTGKALIALGALVLFSPFFSCAGGGEGRKQGNFITIGVLEPLTGIQSGGGKLELEGIELANELHPTVEIGGKPYQVYLSVEDT
jgi:hypothetical protein